MTIQFMPLLASNYNSNKYIDYVMADKEPVILKR